MSENGYKNGENNFKKIAFISVLVLVLLLSVTGGTFAFFALSANNTSTINGTAATLELGLTVDRISPGTSGTNGNYNNSTKVFVPQLNSTLATAISSTNKCIDGNGNIVCSVYQITIKNKSTAAVVLRGDLTFSFTDSNMSNFSWKPLTDATTVNTTNFGNVFYKASTTATTMTTATSSGAVNSKLVTDLKLNAANSGTNCTTTVPTSTTTSSTPNSCVATYFVVVWINEINSNQYADDGTRSFTGTVTFESSNGTGITSTFVS